MRLKGSISAISLFLVLITLVSSLYITASAAENKPSMDNVESVCVVNAEHKKIVLHKDEHKTVYPASTV